MDRPTFRVVVPKDDSPAEVHVEGCECEPADAWFVRDDIGNDLDYARHVGYDSTNGPAVNGECVKSYISDRVPFPIRAGAR